MSTSSDDAPAIVAVVVAQNPGDHFEECLRSLRDQDYGNLSVLVVDAASDEPVAGRVADVLPDAFVSRLTGNATFTVAANQALTLVQGASFLLICHDDVALSERALSVMVEELYRTNAGIVTPKMVSWDDPRRLRQIGMGSDRFGVQVDMLDRDEFDQEQYDSSRDVFVAPTGAQLIRADLFAALDGFDTAMASRNADLDLCWRAHGVGARVVAAPQARVRHKETENDQPIDEQRRELSRNRLRTLLVTSSPFSLIRVLPVAILLLLVEGLYSVLAGRRQQARGAFGAISWNLGRLGEIRKRRDTFDKIRTRSDREIHQLQFGGSARLRNFFQGQFGTGQDRFVGMVGSLRDSLQGEAARSSRVGLTVGTFLVVVLLFGSRHMITRGVIPVGQIPDLPSAGALLGEWWGGWRSAGFGSPGNPSSAFLILGLARVIFFWADGLPELLLILGPLLGGTFAMWRLARPLQSPQASAIAAAVYGFNPLIVSMIAAGRWNALVLWAFAPLMLGSVLRLQGAAPFGRIGGDPGPGIVRRSVPARLVRLGIVVAAASTFVPSAPLMALWMLVAVGLASFLVARPVGLVRLALALPVVIVTPVVLHLPWGFDILRNATWSWIIGPHSPESRFDSLADLIRFSPGSPDPSILTVGILLAAGVSLVIAKSRRFDVAVTGWVMAVGSFMLAWSVRRDWLPFDLPDTDSILVPAAAGLALAVAASVRSFEVDLRTQKFGYRQGVVLLGGFGLLLVTLGGVSNSLDGQWNLPRQGYGQFSDVLTADGDATAGRVLWLAAPEVAPFDTHLSPGGVSYTVTIGGRPDALDRWAPGTPPLDAELGEQIDLAVDGETVALGRLLAVYGINMIAVMPQLAPTPYEGPNFEPASGDLAITDVLTRQLDLQHLTGTPTLSVFRNRAALGSAVSLDGLAELPSDPISRLGFDLTSGVDSGLVPDGAGAWTTREGLPGPTVVAVPGDDWTVSAGSADVSETSAGLLSVVESGSSESGVSENGLRLTHNTPLIRWAAMLVQLLLIAGAIVVAQEPTLERSNGAAG